MNIFWPLGNRSWVGEFSADRVYRVVKLEGRVPLNLAAKSPKHPSPNQLEIPTSQRLTDSTHPACHPTLLHIAS